MTERMSGKKCRHVSCGWEGFSLCVLLILFFFQIFYNGHR